METSCSNPNCLDLAIFSDRAARILAAVVCLLAGVTAVQAATIWHNTNTTTVTAANSISCNLAGAHSDNSYWRTFTPSFYGHSGSFAVSGVRIGVEQAAAGSGTNQPITVRIYANSGGAFPAGTRTLIGTTNTTVANGLGFFQDIAVVATPQPATTEIVVEIFTPDGIAANNSFFIGSNGLGQNAPGYISASACGAPNPTNVAAAGAPNMHMLIALVGSGPTAAGVSISGRVLTDTGRGLMNATVTLTNIQGQSRSARTGAFGYYVFDDLAAGQTYVVGVSSKRYSYSPRAVTAAGAITGEDFTPEGTNLSKGGRSTSPSFSPAASP